MVPVSSLKVAHVLYVQYVPTIEAGLLAISRKNSAIEKFQRVRHQISMKGKPHKEHEKMLYVPALSVNFMLQPHKQIRTNILLSSHNLKLKFMPYILTYTHTRLHTLSKATTGQATVSHPTGAGCLTNPSQLTSYPSPNQHVTNACSSMSVWVCVCGCLHVCVRCIWAMCGFCLTSSISSSRRQSAGECANCFNGLTTWWAMKSFVCLISTVPSVSAEERHHLRATFRSRSAQF